MDPNRHVGMRAVVPFLRARLSSDWSKKLRCYFREGQVVLHQKVDVVSVDWDGPLSRIRRAIHPERDAVQALARRRLCLLSHGTDSGATPTTTTQ